jgi:hypothetical protein
MIVGVEVNRMQNETPLDTPLGTVWVTVSGANAVYVDANSNGKPGLTLRGGGKFHVTIRLECQPDGTWTPSGSVYTSRAWTPNGKGSFDSASKFQVEDLLKKVVPVVARWADTQRDARIEAEQANRQNQYDRLFNEYAEAERKAAVARKALDEAAADLHVPVMLNPSL